MTEQPQKTSRRPWATDVPVALNFFARPDIIREVFETIRQARPRQLFLIADGPRPDKPQDRVNCARCREIVESMIDWDCEVHRLYNTENKGLFHTYFDSMAEVFRMVDRCIFMEDDVVPSRSFFPYCRHLLEAYKDDLRVSFVTGMNYFPQGVHPYAEGDYFFSGEGSLQAYGLWRRTFESMNMDFLQSDYAVKAASRLARLLKPGYEKRIAKYRRDLMWQGHIPHVEIYKNLLRLTQHQICIVPTRNLVVNIGLSTGSAHNDMSDYHMLPKAKWCFFNTPKYEINTTPPPATYCGLMVCDTLYEERMNYITGWNRPALALARRVESAVRHLVYGNWHRVLKKMTLVMKGKYVFDE